MIKIKIKSKKDGTLVNTNFDNADGIETLYALATIFNTCETCSNVDLDLLIKDAKELAKVMKEEE